jgi:hypothetical protein
MNTFEMEQVIQRMLFEISNNNNLTPGERVMVVNHVRWTVEHIEGERVRG